MSISESTVEKWNRKYSVIWDAVEDGDIKLNEWEQDFIDSIGKCLSDNCELSIRQSIVLNRIFERIT